MAPNSSAQGSRAKASGAGVEAEARSTPVLSSRGGTQHSATAPDRMAAILGQTRKVRAFPVTQRDSGTVLDGKYEILDRLATGGMGEVWRARHIHLQELRVIKILRADRATDPHALQRFAQEARIATQIKHPNVAILYDFSRLPDGSFYMVWEHIEGEDVGTCLRHRGPFPVPLAIELGIQALRGLDAIHTAGVIHRDLSPDNLMITRDRRGRPLVKIIDLGLAKNLRASGEPRDHPGRHVHGQAACTARPSRRARSATSRSTTGATSTRSPRCSTRWSPACRRSTPRTRTATSSSA